MAEFDLGFKKKNYFNRNIWKKIKPFGKNNFSN